MGCELECKSGRGNTYKMFGLESVVVVWPAGFVSIVRGNSLFKLIIIAKISNLIERSQLNIRRQKWFF